MLCWRSIRSDVKEAVIPVSVLTRVAVVAAAV